ncbi:hypothetical protein TpMuguga_04g00579 [Theileria parva strain Muguga]|uniref:Uncharacterized protein n=1 Tax=Theileria parva TaxID=5875 RepID=Q4N1Z8_THEPA|nr:uncharacterized protein TpMuguga_04g00579 [Theileria parva strain Muguga]EAN31931.1 hypothetical protein TpMuguga_04g00579 [Theileria parva strain Muguga]|eukprot:XP_764214.1 hypothetical protein [Theileria parva strain Muguga]
MTIKLESVKNSLLKFNQLVKEQSKSKLIYEGWPPTSHIPISNNFGPLGRSVFVMNRRLETGKDFEPTLVFCCGLKPMLMMNKTEFSNLISHLPTIKLNLASFLKLL